MALQFTNTELFHGRLLSVLPFHTDYVCVCVCVCVCQRNGVSGMEVFPRVYDKREGRMEYMMGGREGGKDGVYDGRERGTEGWSI